jgi:hypothetical protein
MDAPLAEVCCACLPAASLAWLASLRVHAGLRVRVLGDRAWMWWTAGDEVVLQRVLALHGVEVFARREGRWYRPGQHLPAFEVPNEDGARPLLHLLTPAPVRADSGAPSFRPMMLELVRDDRPRATSALCCTLADLGRWAGQATSRQLAMLTAICTYGTAGVSPVPGALDQGDASRTGHVLLRGERLPPLSAAKRYWGRTILTPLGFRPEPEVSEGALRLRDEEIALLGEDGFEAIDARLFQPLTRAGARLAAGERR